MAERSDAGMQAEFWNDAGGRMWVENIEQIHRLLQPLGELLTEHAAPRPGEAVLEVGCGGGHNAVALAHRVGSSGYVCGVDLSEPILAYARRQPDLPPQLEYRCVDAAVADLGEGRFDLLFSRFGVMFFADPKAAFANLRRALRPGARLAFLCWQAPQANGWLSAPMEAVFSILPPPEAPADPRAPGPFAFQEQAWIREILDAAGFGEVRVEGLATTMPMGTLEEAVAYSMRFGPAVEALQQASEAERAAVERALRSAYEPFLDDGGRVAAPAATWLVTAKRG